MKILVTGGAGFIGSHIAERYLREGHDVVIIDNLSTGIQKNVPREARFYRMCITDEKVAQILMDEKPDVVSHHAAQIDVRLSVSEPVEDARTNILGTLNLLEASRKSRVSKFIFASTGGAIYGEQQFYPADESHPTSPLSPYGITKLSVEKYLHFYFRTYEIPSVVFRYANVYGPRQNAHGEAGVVAIFTKKLIDGEEPTIYGDGKQTRDYVYVDDVVACNLEALKPEVQGIFNVGTGEETDVNTIAAELIRLLGAEIRPRYAPARAGEQRRSCLKPGALQAKPPISLREGLKKTVEWFQRE